MEVEPNESMPRQSKNPRGPTLRPTLRPQRPSPRRQSPGAGRKGAPNKVKEKPLPVLKFAPPEPARNRRAKREKEEKLEIGSIKTAPLPFERLTFEELLGHVGDGGNIWSARRLVRSLQPISTVALKPKLTRSGTSRGR
jgi:hypothetical protein